MKSPVLLLVFNRPDTTKKVFDAIRLAKPSKLYVVADGPRQNISGESLKCSEVRKIVTLVDWDCKLITLFRNENLGCKYGVASGIDWFFKNEEEGVILEDDCLPTQEFFEFCDVMLEKYRSDDTIGTITGINVFGEKVKSDSYYYSKYQSIWGWATWRSRWTHYKVDIDDRKKIERLDVTNSYPNHFRRHIDFCLDLVSAGLNNTWDYQLQYLLIKKNYLCVRPYANLISNIGPDGVHSYANNKNIFHEYGQMNVKNIICPNIVLENKYEDEKIWLKYKKAHRVELIRIILFRIGIYAILKKYIDIFRQLKKSLKP
jgi:hypothetical protein